MKNLLIVLSLLIPCLVMSQTNKTLKSGEVDKRVSFRMDSLSKKYKKEVVSYMVRISNGKKSRYLTYYKNDKLFKEEIFD